MGGDLRHSISKLVSLGNPELCLLKDPWESITRSRAVKSLRFGLQGSHHCFMALVEKGTPGSELEDGSLLREIAAASVPVPRAPAPRATQRWPGESCTSVMTLQEEIPELREPGLL